MGSLRSCKYGINRMATVPQHKESKRILFWLDRSSDLNPLDLFMGLFKTTRIPKKNISRH